MSTGYYIEVEISAPNENYKSVHFWDLIERVLEDWGLYPSETMKLDEGKGMLFQGEITLGAAWSPQNAHQQLCDLFCDNSIIDVDVDTRWKYLEPDDWDAQCSSESVGMCQVWHVSCKQNAKRT